MEQLPILGQQRKSASTQISKVPAASRERCRRHKMCLGLTTCAGQSERGGPSSNLTATSRRSPAFLHLHKMRGTAPLARLTTKCVGGESFEALNEAQSRRSLAVVSTKKRALLAQ